MNASRQSRAPTPSLQRLVQHRHEPDRYAISFIERPMRLSVDFAPMSRAASEYLSDLTNRKPFLLDDLGKRALDTQTPFVWLEIIATGGRQWRFHHTSRNTIPPETLESMWPPGNFVGLHACVAYAGEETGFGRKQQSEFDILGVVLRSRIAGICHELSLDTMQLHLTAREQAVLKWAAMGKTSEDIAGILDLDKRTVDRAFETAADKLGTNNRIQTVVAAFANNLIA